MFLFSSIAARWAVPQGYREILKVGLPLVAATASSTVMQFTDRFFLARYSVDTIAATMPASMASLTLLLTLMGLCGYATVLIAQYKGSKAPHRIGSALWQGIWCALVCGILLLSAWWFSAPLFALVGHAPKIQVLEVEYFRILTMGSGLALISAVFGSFFSGRGYTRPVMLANTLGAVINVPLDYWLIFGGFGLPPLGITGAAIATVFGWLFTAAILGALIFTRRNNTRFCVLKSWRFESDMFKRLVRFGLPSGFNLFLEMIATTWFSFVLGALGTISLAASNIAFSINSLVFMPVLGMNMAVASLVGQAMGRRNTVAAERIAIHSLHISALYMLPVAACLAIFAPQLMDIFKPSDMSPQEFVQVRELGVVLIYFVVAYSTVDCANIVYLGALKGAGDTLGILMIMIGVMAVCLVLPIGILKYMGLADVYTMWMAFSAYIIFMALAAMARFYRRKWHNIQVVETAKA